MFNKTYDVIVVGAGIEGTATAYSLARRNKKTILVEQYCLPHSRGSSHGQTRIIRRAYTKDYYARMMPSAYRAWADLERKDGVQLYKRTGLFCAADYENKDYITDMKNALNKSRSSYRLLNSSDIKSQYPQFQFNDDVSSIIEPDGGTLKADKALAALRNQFVKRGGKILDGTKVVEILPGRTVTINTRTGDGRYENFQADSIVICAGPWTNDLLSPLNLRLPLTPMRVTVTYWNEKQQLHNVNKGMPCFIALMKKVHLYGLPADEYPGQVKVAVHEGPVIHPDNRDINIHEDQPFINDLSEFVREHLPHLEDKPSVIEKCIYTMTPDSDFILDRHPSHHNIIIGAGFSGHGFKLAPVVGELLADLVEDKTPSHKLSHFRINRFKNLSKL